MSAFAALSRAALKSFFRDRVALFFSFAFPLIFIVIFGLVFADAGSDLVRVGIVGEGPVVEALAASGAVDLERFDTFQDGFSAVAEGDLPALVAVEGGRVTLRFAASDQAAAATVRGIVGGVVNQLNLAEAGVPPRFEITARQVEDATLRPIQFIVPGIMSWGVALGAVFGSAFTLVTWRRKQVLRRIRSAPVSTYVVLASRLTATLLIGLVQAALFIGVGMLPFFGLQLAGRWWLAIPILLLGLVTFFAVGLVIGAFCRTEEATSGVANAIIVPMAFLSGVFFPLELLPGWIRAISNLMPLKHMNEGMTAFLVRNQGPSELVTPSLVLLGFTLVMSLLAARLFRWEAS